MKKLLPLLITIAILVGLVGTSPKGAHAQAATLAFPGAVGFGAQGNLGPRQPGVVVLAVTNLNDSGAGSLRAALENNNPRIVYFKVGGVIDLTENIEVTDPYLYLAGQTALGEGVVLKDGGIRICTHDIIIRGMRVRPADRPDNLGSAEVSTTRRGISVSVNCSDPGDSPHDIVIDHNSIAWAVDGNLDMVGEDIDDITISHNLITESLHRSVHVDEGEVYPNFDNHGTAGIFNQPGSDTSKMTDITVYGNILAHNADRNFTMRSGRTEYINNVLYNWDSTPAYFDHEGASVAQYFAGVGNWIVEGPDTRDDASAPPFWVDNNLHADTRVYLAGNLTEYKTSLVSGDEWDSVTCRNGTTCETEYRYGSYPFTTYITPMSASQAYTYTWGTAGARWPVVDDADQDMLDDIAEASSVASPGASVGEIVDCVDYCDENTDPANRRPDVAGAWPAAFTWSTVWSTVASGSAPTDTDSDGIPDSWEDSHGLDDADSADATEYSSNGYLWMEEYVNSIIDGEGGSSPYLDTENAFSVSATSDDATEDGSGVVTLDGSELGLGSSLVGLRFQNVTVANATTITGAYIQFYAARVDFSSVNIRIWGEDVDSCAAFTTTDFDVSDRNNGTKTAARTNWFGSEPVFAFLYDQTVETPDVSGIVQEIVNRGGWASGNDMCFIMWADANRSFKTYDYLEDIAPRLTIFTP